METSETLERNLWKGPGSKFQTIRALGRARDGSVRVPARLPASHLTPITSHIPSACNWMWLGITKWMYPVPVAVVIMPLISYVYGSLWARAHMGSSPNVTGPKWARAQMSLRPKRNRIRRKGCDPVGPARPGLKNPNLRGGAEPYQNGSRAEGKKLGSPI